MCQTIIYFSRKTDVHSNTVFIQLCWNFEDLTRVSTIFMVLFYMGAYFCFVFFIVDKYIAVIKTIFVDSHCQLSYGLRVYSRPIYALFA